MTEIMMRLVVPLFLFVAGALCIPEQGKWVVPFDEDHQIFGVMKSMYKGTRVAVKITCDNDVDAELEIRWLLRYSPCSEEFIGLEGSSDLQEKYLDYKDQQMIKEFQYTRFEFFNGNMTAKCSDGMISLPDMTKKKPTIVDRGEKVKNSTQAPKPKTTTPKTVTKAPTLAPVATTPKPTTPKPTTQAPARRKRRALANATTVATTNVSMKVDNNDYLEAWKDGVFAYILSIRRKPALVMEKNPKKIHVNVMIEMHGDHGYISAQDWPLLIFYGVMGLVYIIYGVVWLVLLACSWRDLLRVQFWIGAVIALGMLEKAVFYAEFQSISSTGQSVRGAVIFAEFVSCLKRTLARILVIIVSLGFGIVKPRLGPMFRKVVGVGALYFFVSLIEGCMRQLQTKGDNSKDILAAQVPLAVIDASICWWIFASLIQTTRTLRLRRNIVKLSLYRHFTNLLIFAVLASVVYMIWSLSSHKLKVCITDWRELWVDEAFWHLLFSVMLLVIMVLWRPSINNQRYAFSPLLDSADDEDEEALMNDAFDGMKMRGSRSPQNGSPKQKEGRKSIEEDLKWVEENIPESLTDKALPTLLDDSEEEMMTAKYEVNKMQ